MASAGKTLRGYLWWTHDRGSFHYDVMVTLILLFIFVTPRFLNFRDKPAERIAHPTGVAVTSDGNDGLFFQIEASAIDAAPGANLDAAFLRVIEPVSGEVRVLDYRAVTDRRGHVSSYLVHVRRLQ